MHAVSSTHAWQVLRKVHHIQKARAASSPLLVLLLPFAASSGSVHTTHIKQEQCQYARGLLHFTCMLASKKQELFHVLSVLQPCIHPSAANRKIPRLVLQQCPGVLHRWAQREPIQHHRQYSAMCTSYHACGHARTHGRLKLSKNGTKVLSTGFEVINEADGRCHRCMQSLHRPF